MRGRKKQVEAATNDLSRPWQRAPTETEVAEKLGVNVERFPDASEAQLQRDLLVSG